MGNLADVAEIGDDIVPQGGIRHEPREQEDVHVRRLAVVAHALRAGVAWTHFVPPSTGRRPIVLLKRPERSVAT